MPVPVPSQIWKHLPNAIMGDHQHCHGILCILHILYPEVPNIGVQELKFTLIEWMLA
jgi:hypothetical protein